MSKDVDVYTLYAAVACALVQDQSGLSMLHDPPWYSLVDIPVGVHGSLGQARPSITLESVNQQDGGTLASRQL